MHPDSLRHRIAAVGQQGFALARTLYAAAVEQRENRAVRRADQALILQQEHPRRIIQTPALMRAGIPVSHDPVTLFNHQQGCHFIPDQYVNRDR
mgnify:CR=1 FL=1